MSRFLLPLPGISSSLTLPAPGPSYTSIRTDIPAMSNHQSSGKSASGANHDGGCGSLATPAEPRFVKAIASAEAASMSAARIVKETRKFTVKLQPSSSFTF
jgi:hypothetical protein